MASNIFVDDDGSSLSSCLDLPFLISLTIFSSLVCCFDNFCNKTMQCASSFGAEVPLNQKPII